MPAPEIGRRLQGTSSNYHLGLVGKKVRPGRSIGRIRSMGAALALVSCLFVAVNRELVVDVNPVNCPPLSSTLSRSRSPQSTQ